MVWFCNLLHIPRGGNAVLCGNFGYWPPNQSESPVKMLLPRYFRLVVAGLVVTAALASSAAVLVMLWFPNNQHVASLEQVLLSRFRSPQAMGDGGVATDLMLCYPMGLARSDSSALLFSDRGRFRRGRVIWQMGTDGIVNLFAGTGLNGTANESRAKLLRFDKPEGLAVSPNGDVYISDGFNHVVLRVTTNGEVEKFAGTGEAGFSGDNGPAIAAKLHRPADIRLDREGNLYISDVRNARIRKVDPSGRIETIVGNGTPGFSPDGTPAAQAMINNAWGIAIDNEQRLLIADSNNHRIRRLENDGSIATIAGNGEQGYAGDGGHALSASFYYPEGLAVDEDGRIYVGDEWNHAVRVIDNAGMISTLIGTGKAGYSEFGSVTAQTAISDPQNLLIDVDGSLLIAEGGNGRIIRVRDGTMYPVAGRGDLDSCDDLF